jgi:hypothetical protein
VNVPRQENRLTAIHTLSQGLLRVLSPDQEDKFEQDFGLWIAHHSQLAVRENLLGENVSYALGNWAAKNRERSSPAGAPQGLDTTLVAGMFLQVILEAEHLPGNTLERTNYVKQAVKNFLVQRLAGQITLSQFFRLVQIIEHEVTYYFHRLQGEWLSPEDDSFPPAVPALQSSYTINLPAPIKTYELRLALSRLPLPHQANRKLSPDGLLDFLVKSEGRWFRLLDFETQFRLNKKTAWSYLTLLLHHDILKHNDEKANKVRYALSPKFLASENEPRR